ncbi:hypothetical protein B0A55_09999 [Friedmanniomyces simplex]|uniref:Uncharacterized protein n=1 Tax=Friedmanniomyces simplex TaxID=329884 RepID=A0A4U0WTD4_9PEZI|nr:hypothetical protein B0A55_09999 [Friedmanniomyces simplex]
MVLPLLQSLLLARKTKQAHNGSNQATPKTPISKTNKLRCLAVLPVILTAIALLLSILCVFAGQKPGMMEDHAIFTLNTSRIGENILQKLDSKISSIHLKRSEPIQLFRPTITAAPTTLITMAPRGLASDLNSLTDNAGSEIDSLTSDAGSAVNSAGSAVQSKATSIGSAVASAATSAVGAAETSIINAINKAYHGVIADLQLKDFYSVHISTTCEGTYQFKNGTNITVGDSGLPTKVTHSHVDSCSSHSAIDPMQFVRILYWIGIVLTAAALVLALLGLVRPTRKIALLNVFGTLPAFLFIFLASAVTHGVPVGAEHLVNSIGQDIGISGQRGDKFLQMTWATTILLLINMAFWGLLFFLGGRGDQCAGSRGFDWKSRTRPDRTSGVALGMISKPLPAHVDRNGNTMI